MTGLTVEQKQSIKSLYKVGRKTILLEAHVNFLSKSLDINFIPKCFRIKICLPGNQKQNENRIEKVSIEAMKDEHSKHINQLNAARVEFSRIVKDMDKVFNIDEKESELKRVMKHMGKVKHQKEITQMKKLPLNLNEGNQDNDVEATFINGTGDVTLVPDDGQQIKAHKKKRSFRRRYLQPQPRRSRNRPKPRQSVNPPEGWNGVVKNISDEAVTEVEENLFKKGKKFCPVELDPPIIRMQKELNQFYRNLRLEWHFYNQVDKRTEMEKKFYQKSDWSPPKAGCEIEKMISRVQEMFDKWKPPRFVKDNLTKDERKFIQDAAKNENIIYMWEDKGPSFV